jgi:integrase
MKKVGSYGSGFLSRIKSVTGDLLAYRWHDNGAESKENLSIPLRGWHTLRHSYTTLLRQKGNNPKVVQDLLRHVSYGITMNIYDAAVSDERREAHRGVLHLVTRTQTRTGEESGTSASS